MTLTFIATVIGDFTDENNELAYDAASRPLKVSYRDPTGEEILTYENGYDREGNLVREFMDSIAVRSSEKNFSYDDNNRMVESGLTQNFPELNFTRQWQLDGVGNRVAEVTNNWPAKLYSTNELNQYTDTGKYHQYTYDSSGNMSTSWHIWGDMWAMQEDYTWDAFNRLVRYQRSGEFHG